MEQTLHDTLIKNREEKTALLERMLSLTEKQKDQLEKDQVEEIAETFAAWEKVSQNIDVLEGTYREAVLLVEREAPKDREALLALLNGIEEKNIGLLERIQKLHQENSTLAQEKMQDYRNELKNVKKSNERVQSYLDPYASMVDGVYFDQKK
ncbi:hypothetical protein LJC20_02145 [Eubacteriales bacterium OttesenSCG-928-M02]|nr:hypothetical protein [Eubacteriales bacterium OttesenSCG-928-M02]